MTSQKARLLLETKAKMGTNWRIGDKRHKSSWERTGRGGTSQEGQPERSGQGRSKNGNATRKGEEGRAPKRSHLTTAASRSVNDGSEMGGGCIKIRRESPTSV